MLELFITAIIVAISFYGYIVYGVETKRKILRPRATTWFIWAVLGACVSYLQLRHGAGLGAVVTILSAVSNFVLAGMAWHYGHKNIHPIDMLSGAAAIGVVVLWVTTTDEVTTVFATLTYLFGFIPTFERAWRKPFAENITPFFMSALKYALSLLVVGTMTIETVLYPVTLSIFNAVFLVMVLRRRRLQKIAKKTLAKKPGARYSK